MKRRLPGVALIATLAAGCASHGKLPGPEENPALVAAVRAQVRIVGSETTWVTQGPGYDLVGFTQRDIASVDSSIYAQSRMYNTVFGEDPPHVVVTITHVGTQSNGARTMLTPPLPSGSSDPIVRVGAAARSRTTEGQRGGSARSETGGTGDGQRFSAASSGNASEPVMRTWLSARATKVTGRPPMFGGSGQEDDARVPAWAESLLPKLITADTARYRLAKQLAGQLENLYPLRQFFTMGRPDFVPVAANGEQGGRQAGGGGGYGGRGGMGGMRGGRSRRGGGENPSGGDRQGLSGAAMFDAEATVLGQYLALRQGAPLIGHLVDGQVRGQTVGDVLAKQPGVPSTLDALESDWLGWLAQHSDKQYKLSGN